MAQVALLVSVLLTGMLAGGAWDGPVALVAGAAGLALIVAGGAFAGRGLVDLGSPLTPLPRPREDSQLVVTGAYAWVRHPIYGGLTLAAIGWGLLAASPLALLLALGLGVFLDLKARREEAWLSERYAAYAGYMQGTRRLIPWVW